MSKLSRGCEFIYMSASQQQVNGVSGPTESQLWMSFHITAVLGSSAHLASSLLQSTHWLRGKTHMEGLENHNHLLNEISFP